MIEKDLGFIDFEEFLKIQDEIWKKRVRDAIPDMLLFAEHPVTFSLGARPTKDQLSHLLTWPEILAELGIKIVETGRGGNVTLHAPGILGIYPVVKVAEPSDGIKLVDFLEGMIIAVLENFGIDARRNPAVNRLVDFLEGMVIAVLENFGIDARRNPAVNRGVWVKNRKIASVGIQVSKLVSKFGINLNVSPKLKLFKHINPCGIPGCKVTSIKKELGYAPLMDDVKRAILYNVHPVTTETTGVSPW